jgi:hypothetical protein
MEGGSDSSEGLSDDDITHDSESRDSEEVSLASASSSQGSQSIIEDDDDDDGSEM